MWFSKVVLPAPRKPVRMLTGTTFFDIIKKRKKSDPADAESLLQINQKSIYTRPAFFSVRKAPFFVIVFRARAVRFTTTSRFNTRTQIRFVSRVGRNNLGLFGVTCRPTPPFFLAMPRL